jgi:hypothetical protein
MDVSLAVELPVILRFSAQAFLAQTVQKSNPQKQPVYEGKQEHNFCSPNTPDSTVKAVKIG